MPEQTPRPVTSIEKRAGFILNPHASRGVAGGVQEELLGPARKLGWDTVFRTTNRAGHEVELAAEMANEGWPVVIAAGGDGTVHGVANALLDADGAPVLGHIPIGTGNDFAKLLNLRPRSVADNVHRILTQGVVRAFDVGLVENEYFINGMGIGFDAEVVRQTLNMHRLKGFLLYLAAVYRTFWRFKPPTLGLVSAEHKETGVMMMLEIAIGTTAGGGFRLTPNAEPDDGLFDVCVIGEVSVGQFLRWVPRCIKGTHIDLDPVTMFQTSRIVITGIDRPLALHLDGELRLPKSRSVSVELLPRRLNALCAS